jgi:EAL domain-containing protein (putative c-di-GMP-specific phosphodiesterase class I)
MRIVYQEGTEIKVLSPDTFLKEAIKEDLYISLFQNMIRNSLHHFRDKKEMISLNFLPDDLFNTYIMQEFVQNIKMFDSPSRVVVEISEVECAKNFSKLLQVAKKLKELGVCICIDDFDGTFLDNSTLLAINPHYIKINGTFVTKAKAKDDERMHSIVEFAKEHNIKTAVEFVTDKETFELLKTYGIDEFQGYYFGEAREVTP